MYNEFDQNITKESDPVRQKHYTTKKHWLVDFINIFWFILKLLQITMNVYNHIAEKSHVENEMSKMNLPETVPAVV